MPPLSSLKRFSRYFVDKMIALLYEVPKLEKGDNSVKYL